METRTQPAPACENMTHIHAQGLYMCAHSFVGNTYVGMDTYAYIYMPPAHMQTVSDKELLYKIIRIGITINLYVMYMYV